VEVFIWKKPGEKYLTRPDTLNEPFGYRGDRDLTNAEPTELLSFFLTDDVWTCG